MDQTKLIKNLILWVFFLFLGQITIGAAYLLHLVWMH